MSTVFEYTVCGGEAKQKAVCLRLTAVGSNAALLSTLLAGVPFAAGAQARHIVSGKAICESCRIELRREVVLLDTIANDSRQPSTIKRDQRGHYYVLRPWARPDNPSPDLPAVFDSSGRFIRRIGRIGSGNGLFTAARFVGVGSQDSIFIFDPGNQRLTITTPDFRVLRAIPLSVPLFAVEWVSGDFLVVSGNSNSSSNFGQPLHLLNTEGRYLLSFGEDHAAVIPINRDELLFRHLTRSAEGGFWSADAWNRYRLQKWNVRGQLQYEMVRKVDWFVERNIGPVELSPESPPLPSIAAIMEGEGGLVWVFARVASGNWAEALVRQRAAVGAHPSERRVSSYEIGDAEKAYDTIIEVFDPHRSAIVASARVDEVFRYNVGPNRVGRVRKIGAHYLPEVWTVRLVR